MEADRIGMMRARGHDLLRMAASDAPVERLRATFDRLWTAYETPPRAYHTIFHAFDVFETCTMLAAWDPATRRLDDTTFRAVLTAALYHDVVYVASAADNERASALVAREHLTDLGAPEAIVTETVRLVLLTAGHAPGDDDVAGHLLCDADLAVLGGDAEAYETYRQQVRAEHAHVDDRRWAAGRARVLRGLLERETIYRTARARRDWEAAARTNLTRELRSLEAT